MKMEILCGAVLFAVTACAQDPAIRFERFEGPGPAGPEGSPRPALMLPGGGDAFFGGKFYLFDGGRTVTGAPYSADELTESTRTLSDGNRITTKVSAKVYRDSQGRVRSERTGEATGQSHQTIVIDDPAANTEYHLDPSTHTATKITRSQTPPNGEAASEAKLHAESDARRRGHEIRLREPAVAIDKLSAEALTEARVVKRIEIVNTERVGGQAKKEMLGTQNIEGVSAQGTRITETISVGQIGNDRPIDVVTENWFAPDLKVTVLSKHSDPRTGETVHKLMRINRTEPDPSLFQLPPDYTVSRNQNVFFQTIEKTVEQ